MSKRKIVGRYNLVEKDNKIRLQIQNILFVCSIGGLIGILAPVIIGIIWFVFLFIWFFGWADRYEYVKVKKGRGLRKNE